MEIRTLLWPDFEINYQSKMIHSDLLELMDNGQCNIQILLYCSYSLPEEKNLKTRKFNEDPSIIPIISQWPVKSSHIRMVELCCLYFKIIFWVLYIILLMIGVTQAPSHFLSNKLKNLLCISPDSLWLPLSYSVNRNLLFLEEQNPQKSSPE